MWLSAITRVLVLRLPGLLVLPTFMWRTGTAQKEGYMNKCVFCGESAQGNYTIHRDGMGVGPEVNLCDSCGEDEFPSCEQIWEKIARPNTAAMSYRRLYVTAPSPVKQVLLN